MNVHARGEAFGNANGSFRPERKRGGAADIRALTDCPCCGQAVSSPPLDAICDAYGIDGHAAAILRTVWAGKGHPVMAERAFDEMYADDPDGGPSPTRMYRDFWAGLALLDEKLQGSAVSVVNVGYRQGWRLVIRPVL